MLTTLIFPTVHIGFATINSLLFDSSSSDMLKLAVGRILKLGHMPHSRGFILYGSRRTLYM